MQQTYLVTHLFVCDIFTIIEWVGFGIFSITSIFDRFILITFFVYPPQIHILEIEMVSRKTTTTHAKKTDSKAVDLAVGNSDFTREIDKTGDYF